MKSPLIQERQIILTDEEIQGMLNGNTSQIRRPNNLIPSWDHYGTDIMDWALSGVRRYNGNNQKNNTWVVEIQSDVDDTHCDFIKCPFGAENDILYVRETWRGYVKTNAPGEPRKLEVPQYTPDEKHCKRLEYKADGLDGKWKSPVSMPKWASRLKLKITKIDIVRVDRGVWDWVVGVEKINTNH